MLEINFLREIALSFWGTGWSLKEPLQNALGGREIGGEGACFSVSLRLSRTQRNLPEQNWFKLIVPQ